HTGHVIPAHKPKSFPDAVHRLRELNGRIGLKVSERKLDSLLEDRTLPIALDIATWLPEIAADSDLPEGLWNKVDGLSGIIVADYKKILAGVATGDGPVSTAATVDDAGRTILDLETLLAGTDPHWFDGGAERSASR